MSLGSRGKIPLSISIRPWGKENGDACEFIRLALANVGRNVVTPQIMIRDDVDPEIVEYLLSESMKKRLTPPEIGLELVREGLEHVLAGGWQKEVVPEDVGIELLRLGFEMRLADARGKMFGELGIE